MDISELSIKEQSELNQFMQEIKEADDRKFLAFLDTAKECSQCHEPVAPEQFNEYLAMCPVCVGYYCMAMDEKEAEPLTAWELK